MMYNGAVDNAYRPLDIGNFPPWHITVTVAGGETRHFDIPYPLSNNVTGLPLGLGVPQVIAGRYEVLLRMVQGMRDLITGIVRDLAQCQQDAARFREDAARFREDAIRFRQEAARCLKNANRYYCELEKLKFRKGGKVVASQVLMSPVSSSSSKKRKLGSEVSGFSQTQAVCIVKPEHLPSPKSNDRPSVPGLLVQESVIEENMEESDDLPQRKDVPTSAALVCSDVQTEKVESVTGVVPVRQSVDASTLCTSANCLTVDSTTLCTSANVSNSIDITPPINASANVPGQAGDEEFEYDVLTEQVASVTGVMLVEESVDATMTCASTNCPTADSATLTSSTPINFTPPYVQSTARVSPVEEPVDATMTSTHTNCQTVDSSTLPISAPIGIIPSVIESTSFSGQGEDEGFEDVENLKLDDLPLSSMKRSGREHVTTSASLICSEVKTEMVESVAGELVVWEPVDATMTSTSVNCQTVNCTALTNSTPADNTLPIILSTSVSNIEGDEWFEYVDNFRIPKVYADLYMKIFSKYGHMATKKVVRSNDDILLAAVTRLIKIVSAMETIRGVDLSIKLIESWEGDIGDAETLQFNIKWLRETFNAVKNSWKSSFKIDKEVETIEQVLDATQVEYFGLCSRKDELESELLELKTKIREFEAQISSEREAIQLRLNIDEQVGRHEQVLDAEQVKYVGLNSRKDELEIELVEVKINIRKCEAKISSEREATRKKDGREIRFLV